VILFLLNTKDDILKNVSNQTGPVDFHSRKKKYYGSQWVSSTVWLPIFFKISSFVFSKKKEKKLKQVWNKW